MVDGGREGEGAGDSESKSESRGSQTTRTRTRTRVWPAARGAAWLTGRDALSRLQSNEADLAEGGLTLLLGPSRCGLAFDPAYGPWGALRPRRPPTPRHHHGHGHGHGPLSTPAYHTASTTRVCVCVLAAPVYPSTTHPPCSPYSSHSSSSSSSSSSPSSAPFPPPC
jgi:hypothetical protein